MKNKFKEGMYMIITNGKIQNLITDLSIYEMEFELKWIKNVQYVELNDRKCNLLNCSSG